MPRAATMLILWLAWFHTPVLSQANGKLQIHFMDVGQGDGALLISPGGETVLFDNGALGQCNKPIAYLRSLGITRIDHHVVSHYHADHIGCTESVFSEFPLRSLSFDRGGEYRSQTFNRYVQAVGAKRVTAVPGDVLVLDRASPTPVQVTLIALNGNGIYTRNENDLSLVAVVKFGDFETVIGGDLSGFNTSSYRDIETSVAPLVGQVEVYKVHHHCSRYSSNQAWLHVTWPKVGIVSTGSNSYGHPTQECLDRLHAVGTRTYWTSMGAGAIPDRELDVIAQGSIIVEVGRGGQSFTVRPANGLPDHFSSWGHRLSEREILSTSPHQH